MKRTVYPRASDLPVVEELLALLEPEEVDWEAIARALARLRPETQIALGGHLQVLADREGGRHGNVHRLGEGIAARGAKTIASWFFAAGDAP